MADILSIAPFLDGLTVRPGASHYGLHIFPVCEIPGRTAAECPELLSLAQGLSSGRLLIGETGEMDKVRIRNASGAGALLLDGETLIGGAQNRMINAAAVVPSRHEADLPCSCVEVRRWDMKRKDDIPEGKRAFRVSAMAYGRLRRLRMEHAHRSLRADRSVRVEQDAVWKDIVSGFGVSGANTKTLDLHDLYEHWDAALRMIEPRFFIHKNQAGIMSFLDRRTWHLDLFRDHDMLYKYFKPLVRAYAFEALIRLESGTPARGAAQLEHARDIFKSLRTTSCHAFAAPGGAARAVFFATRAAHGTALLADSHLIQLTACSK